MRKVILFFGLMVLTQTIFAQLSWTKKNHDFGQTQLNIPLAYEFSYFNTTNTSQKIAFVKLSTNGIKPDWDDVTIEKNQGGRFFLNYSPSKTGVFEEKIEIYLENNSSPEILTITGFVGEKATSTYYKPSISGETNASKPADSPMIEPIEEWNNPAKPMQKEKYEDEKLEIKPPSNLIRKPQKPGRPQIITAANSAVLETSILPTYIGNIRQNTAANAAYFTEREKAMIQEVNLMRSNPKAYAKVVAAYIATMEADKSSGDYYKEEIKVGKVLIEELKQTPTLSILYPSESMYKSTVAHGKEGQEIGELNHQGKNGLWPWDRVLAADKNMQDGNENIIGGMSDIRKAVLTLLIDADVSGNMHRKTLLDPKWTHIACYEIGDIGGMPNMWLQTFGQVKTGISPNTPSTGFINGHVKPGKPELMQKPGKPISPTASITSIGKPQINNLKKRNEPNVNLASSNNEEVFGNYTASTTVVNIPSNIETNELSISSLGKNIFPDGDCRTAESAVYMSEREQEMVAEVNLLRTQPQRYVEIIEDYVSFIEAQINADSDVTVFYREELKSAEELIELLDRLEPLSAAKPNRDLYNGARIYGEAGKVRGNLEFQGSDGSSPLNRIMKAAPAMVDGAENLPHGSTNIRYSIIKLLIDKDDKLRKQRKVLLNPKWDFLAVYEVGKVGNVHYWIQDFGDSRAIAMEDLEKENTDDGVLGFANPPMKGTSLLPNIKAPSGEVYEVDFLSKKEQDLLREVNLLRTNPIFYADIINEYIQVLKSEKVKNTIKSAYYQEQIDAAKFIYQKLIKLEPVSAIVPNQMLYNAAYNHGRDCQKSGRFEHWGSNGSNTWERLQGAAPGIIDGDQILVGDATDLREVIILMLVNQVLYNRNRSLVILQPQWTNIAAAAVGTVGKRENCWIITLGQL